MKGYLAGGKTGTAQKVDPLTKAYASNQYVSSFIGFSPLDDPQILVYVVFDTPRANGYYGGVVAAPAFRNIVENTMGYLGIPPRFVEKDQMLAKTTDSTTQKVARENDPKLMKPASSYILASQDLEQNKMPDLKGLSLGTLMRLSYENSIRLNMNGSGFVVRQVPQAGARLSKNWTVSLAGM